MTSTTVGVAARTVNGSEVLACPPPVAVIVCDDPAVVNVIESSSTPLTSGPTDPPPAEMVDVDVTATVSS